jgi:hypothetical protein
MVALEYELARPELKAIREGFDTGAAIASREYVDHVPAPAYETVWRIRTGLTAGCTLVTAACHFVDRGAADSLPIAVWHP